MDILKQLYDGEIAPWLWKITDDEDYANAETCVGKCHDKLNKMLNKEEKEILKKLIENNTIIEIKENSFFFIKGFKLGISIVMASLS